MITFEQINFDRWELHKPNTWDYRYADLIEDKKPMEHSKLSTIPKGTTVKINMVSRFGDVGITTNFEEDVRYSARIYPHLLTNFRKEFDNVSRETEGS